MQYLLSAFSFLIDVILGIFIILLTLRFLLQWIRVPYSDSLGINQFIFLLTQPIIQPLNRFIPKWRGQELSTPLLIWLLSLLSLLFLTWLSGKSPYLLALSLFALGEMIETIIYIFIISLLIQAVMSFVNIYHPINQFLNAFTAPILKPIQKYIQPMNGIDLSLLIAMVLLQLALILIVAPLKNMF